MVKLSNEVEAFSAFYGEKLDGKCVRVRTELRQRERNCRVVKITGAVLVCPQFQNLHIFSSCDILN